VNYGYTFTLPAIIKTSPRWTMRASATSSPHGILRRSGMIFNAWLSDRTGKAYLHMLVPSLLESLCLLVVALTLKPWIAVLYWR